MTVVITGATSGIGYAAARRFASEGWVVYSVARHSCDIPGAKSIICDITDEQAVSEAFSEIPEIDVLINNAGFGISGAVEFTTLEEMKSQFELNFFAQMTVTKAALPAIKKSRGKILFTSSAASVFSIPFQSFYSATKSSVESLTKALANELAMFGVQVGCVRLGDIKTGFTDARKKSIVGDDVYCGKIAKSIAVMEHDERNGMEPADIADVMFRLSKKKKLPVVTTVGIQYKLLCSLAKVLPESTVNMLIGKIYIP